MNRSPENVCNPSRLRPHSLVVEHITILKRVQRPQSTQISPLLLSFFLQKLSYYSGFLELFQ